MAYVIEQTEALLRVLERAVSFVPHRLAGYAANAEFWASEICHCRDLLDGYFGRYQRMKQGAENFLREHPEAPTSAATDTRTTRATKDSEIREMRRRLDEATSRFFACLHDAGLLSDECVAELERSLGHEIFER